MKGGCRSTKAAVKKKGGKGPSGLAPAEFAFGGADGCSPLGGALKPNGQRRKG
jgi:hypothetical protein